MDTIEVRCTPGNMPAQITIDITEMQPGDVIRLADITLPAGVTATGDEEMPVVTTLHTAAEAAEAAEGEGEGEAAEGSEAEAAGDDAGE